ncbi:hypothetical protein SO694_000382107 [Aureococcus anophagefferens]|uniref:ENTH domain-containing protein n=1 Tax=Aureococcus anophagefferens TaxID=44056 RepID=A0ABR1FM12_AURAN
MLQRAQRMAAEASKKALETTKTAASRAKVLAAEAAVKGHEASRLAKAYYSSEYEKFLLTATWPSDQRVSPQLAKRLVESVARFPARPHALPDDDPYRVTLRKLWKKMVEKDWRTTTKALYLLHALSRSTPTKNARALSRTLKSMVGDADPKSGKKYFSRRELVALRDADDAGGRAALVDAYAGFVLRRALLFAGKFEDVSPPSKKKKAAAPEACDADADAALLKRAQNALLVADHALQFVAVALDDGDPRRAHLVVVSCLELVVADLVEAWARRWRQRFARSSPRPRATATTRRPPRARRRGQVRGAPTQGQEGRQGRAEDARFFDLRVSSGPSCAGDVDDAALEAALAKGGGAEEAEDDDEDDEADEEDDDDEDEEDEEEEDEEDEEEEEDEEDEEDEDDEEEDDEDDDERRRPPPRGPRAKSADRKRLTKINVTLHV